MQRLTIPDQKMGSVVIRSIIDARKVKEHAMTIYWALKKYEDTGLTPDEIIELKERMNDGWIPVEERLPEEGQEVWVSLKTDCVRRGMYTKRLGDRRLEGFICSDGFMRMNTANAWKPYVVPDPYRPERSNDAKE